MMSAGFKLLLPLLKNTNLKKEHLTKEAGFVEAYTDNSNIPLSNNNVFLLYEYIVDNKEKAERFDDLRGCIENDQTSKYFINGKYYLVYRFELDKTTESGLNKTGIFIPYMKKSKEKIIDFWGSSDEDVLDYILGKAAKNPAKYEIKKSFIPERENAENFIKTKIEMLRLKEGLTIKKAPKVLKQDFRGFYCFKQDSPIRT